MKDLKNRVAVAHLLDAGAVSADTKTKYVDLAGFKSAIVLVNLGSASFSSASIAPILQESDSTADASFTNVAASDMIGSFSAVSDANSDQVTQVVGYIGSKRYIRVFLDISGTLSIPASVDAVLSDAVVEPTPTPTTGTAS
jgi:hypothetical protein